jgi:hypothetical protein
VPITVGNQIKLCSACIKTKQLGTSEKFLCHGKLSWSLIKGLMIYSSSTVLHKLVAEEKRVDGLLIKSSFAGFPAEEWMTTVTWPILSKLNRSFR